MVGPKPGGVGWLVLTTVLDRESVEARVEIVAHRLLKRERVQVGKYCGRLGDRQGSVLKNAERRSLLNGNFSGGNEARQA